MKHTKEPDKLDARRSTGAMKKLLGISLVALLGVGACDAGSDDDGTGSAEASSGSADTNQTTNETLTTSTPTTGATDSATSGDTTTTDGTSSGESTTTDATTEGESGSSTGEPGGATPCQPQMSRAQIERWHLDVEGHMPTFAEIARPRHDFQADPSAADGLSGGPNPQGGGFIQDPDGGGVTIECDIWAQDCVEGEKCAAWANDGGSSWNATRCVPVDAAPVGPGDPCTVVGSGVSGLDNCDETSMCWDADPDTNVGTCVALCEGSENAPTCAPEGTACSISNEGVLILCLPICNPLADECGDGQGCFPVGEFFQCAPVAAGAEPGEPCQFVNACADGSACVTAGIVPGCAGGACCSSYCDVMGDGSECLEGQECMPWYEMGQEPDVCLEGVGVCAVPG